jgi:hypothetical protein
MSRAGILNGLWVAANLRHRRALLRALGNPQRVQEKILARYLHNNRDTDFGRRHGFASVHSVADFQARVPLSEYDDYSPWIARIQRGEQGILTREKVTRLVPSGGSTSARKLIPFTSSLRAEFNRGIGAWIADLYLQRPQLLGGLSYWSITPALPMNGEAGGSVPIGFDSDSDYLGSWMRPLVDATFAVRGAVSELHELALFRYATLRDLLRARQLSLLSVWHPSFLPLLLEPLTEHWDRLLDDIESGELSLVDDHSASLRQRLRRRPDPRRARELREIGPEDLRGTWPRLALLSCWTDAHAAGGATVLAQRFPGVEIQPKGLVATEAFVTLPLGGSRPVSLLSHFFEFLDASERPHCLHEVVPGEEYSLVVTTAGGLYRYRMHDRVRVESLLNATPCLRFLGKEDCVSDRFGEKLDENFVAATVTRVLGRTQDEIPFAMLAPDERAQGLGYTLYLGSCDAIPGDLEARLEEQLRENPHYAYCVQLGQLQAARVFRVSESADRDYLRRRSQAGQRLGDIKPAALSQETGWSGVFRGGYLTSTEG